MEDNKAKAGRGKHSAMEDLPHPRRERKTLSNLGNAELGTGENEQVLPKLGNVPLQLDMQDT